MRSYGIDGKILKWTEAFLMDRQQKVIVNGAESDWARVTSGIPQGSVLGPILFIIFINDMPGETNCPIKLFADDAKLFQSVAADYLGRSNLSSNHLSISYMHRFHRRMRLLVVVTAVSAW